MSAKFINEDDILLLFALIKPIRAAMEEKNISQKQLAAMLNKKEPEISKFLSGRHNPTAIFFTTSMHSIAIKNNYNFYTPMTPLQNLPPKVKASINEYLKQFDAKIGMYGHIVISANYGQYIPVPEPAVIGLLTAWLESEGCRWEKYEYGQAVWYIFYEEWHTGDTFWQAFEKVIQIMEENNTK